ncbi:hypothetical protein CQW23_08820 [Capsicum baccatum]|uniref:Uncharacterized protein n=1 Tax=Capsicum baccatum TaxID=33114 RepID=A0A2G2XA53_CAPBA|nr:hypothetical protein CQW23_08820 [Capsicum baccatum]
MLRALVSKYGPRRADQNRDSQTFIPLTVEEIRESVQSSGGKTNFLIGGVDVNNVEVVGTLFDKTPMVGRVSFKVKDGTGHLDCIRWDCVQCLDTKGLVYSTRDIYHYKFSLNDYYEGGEIDEQLYEVSLLHLIIIAQNNIASFQVWGGNLSIDLG